MNRFLFSDVGREVLARSSELKVQMFHTRTGQLFATYELSGCVGKDPFADCDDDDDEAEDDPLSALKLERREAARKDQHARDMAFMFDLMRQFEKVER